MPPKIRFTSENIIETAFDIVRRRGWEGLSARSIARELDSSTRPIYSYLKSMDNIEEEVVKKALELFLNYMTTPRTGDVWLDQGLGYVLFAQNEKNLFRYINDEKHIALTKKYGADVWKALGKQLYDYESFQGLSEDQLLKIRLARWFFIHGLASLINNRWYPIEDEKNIIMKEDKNISIAYLIQKNDQALLNGLGSGK